MSDDSLYALAGDIMAEAGLEDGWETIQITRKEYESLLKDREWLECLEAAGVDNWPGIEEAIRIQNERNA